MSFDFDRLIERRGTNSLKYDFAVERGLPKDVLPLWVADMDFQSPPAVTEALIKAAKHGIFGYSEVKDSYYEALTAWFRKRFDTELEPRAFVKTPGVVFAIAQAVRAFSEEGDGVLIQPPVYYPFYEVIRDNHRTLVENPLVLKDGHYEIDFEDLEQKLSDKQVKIFLFCSPHNPVGRVWTEEELKKIGLLCEKHDVILISDEIHCDLIRPGYKHIPIVKACPEQTDRIVMMTAPSKTFNTPGLQNSNIYLPYRPLRVKFRNEVASTGYSQQNLMSLVASEAAYRGGEEWLTEVLSYLEHNYQILKEYVEKHLPKAKLIEPEGTYFAWIDFSGYGLTDEELEHKIIYEAGLWLDAGTVFGKEAGSGFERLVYATPEKILREALERLGRAFEK